MTRLAAIAEIHGNSVALEAVLESVNRSGADLLLVCGGMALGGPDPAGVLDTVRELEEDGAMVVSGASDLAIADFDLGLLRGQDPSPGSLQEAGHWAHEALGPERVDWLRRLPGERRMWINDTLVLLSQRLPAPFSPHGNGSVPEQAEFHTDARVLCHALTHVSGMQRVRDRLLLNVGSAGATAEGRPGATWGRIDIDDGGKVSAEIVRVAFDVDAAADAVAARGLPGDNARAEAIRRGRWS